MAAYKEENMTVMTVAEVKALEQSFVNGGTSLYELMSRAGAAVADAVKEVAPEPCPVVILCGLHNNGGDGWAAARLLAEAGYAVKLVTARGGRGIMVDPARQMALDVEVWRYDHDGIDILVAPNEAALNAALSDALVIVDALFGMGFSGAEIREPYAMWVKAANTRRVFSRGACKTVAVDVPSGLSADTGQAARPCIVADVTVTMLACKAGLVDEKAASWVGEIKVATLKPEETPALVEEPAEKGGSFAIFKRMKEMFKRSKQD